MSPEARASGQPEPPATFQAFWHPRRPFHDHPWETLPPEHSGSEATTYVVEADGTVRYIHPPRPIGCACGLVMDRGGCVPEYEMPGVGAVVPKDAYVALRARSWRWRLENWWAEKRVLHG